MHALQQSLALGFAALPLALVVALLVFSERRSRIRLAAAERQIAVTDAIHGEVGPIVSPVVRRRFGGRWQLAIPVPFDDPDAVSRVIRAAHRAFDAREHARPGHFEIVLSPQEQGVPRRERPAVAPRGPRGESASWT